MGQLRKRGGIWWIRYYRNGRRFEESAHTATKDVARDLLKTKEGDIAKGVPVSPRLGRLRFEDAAADILAEYTMNGRKTRDDLQRRIDHHLAPVFGGRRLSEITTADVRAYAKARLEAGASPAGINRELAVLKRMYSLSVSAGRLHTKPHIPMLAEHNIRRGFFERDQLDAVKRHIPLALQGIIEFAYLTGWRLASEILPLEWRQVDWTGRVVQLDPGTTKNGEGRSFPFTAAVETLLRSQWADHVRLAQTGQIIPYVFHRHGKQIRNLRGAWVRACTAAGLPGRLLHDFRRSAVRNLERAGVSRSAAMAMVGHKTESIYHRYAIVDSATLREAAARIDQVGTGTITGTVAGTAGKTAPPRPT